MKLDISSISSKLKQEVLKQASKQLVELTKEEVGLDQGLLRSTIHYEKYKKDGYIVSHDPNITRLSDSYGPYNYGVGSFQDYGAIHELGRGPIDMVAKGKSYPLHWKKDGQDIYAWRVKGVKPKRFYKKAEKRFDINKISVKL